MDVQLEATLGDVTRVSVSGQLRRGEMQDNEIAKFEAHVAGKKKNAVVNMSKVSLLTSLGIRMLLETAKALKAAGARMALTGLNDSVRESLELTGLVGDILVAEDEDKALALLKGK